MNEEKRAFRLAQLLKKVPVSIALVGGTVLNNQIVDDYDVDTGFIFAHDKEFPNGIWINVDHIIWVG